jgi:hypothetical protein
MGNGSSKHRRERKFETRIDEVVNRDIEPYVAEADILQESSEYLKMFTFSARKFSTIKTTPKSQAQNEDALAELQRLFKALPSHLPAYGKIPLTELIQKGISANLLKDFGYTALQLRKHFSAIELKQAEYTTEEILGAGYTASELRQAGYRYKTLIDNSELTGFTTKDLILAGYRIVDIFKAELSKNSKIAMSGNKIQDLRKNILQQFLIAEIISVEQVQRYLTLIPASGNTQVKTFAVNQGYEEVLEGLAELNFATIKLNPNILKIMRDRGLPAGQIVNDCRDINDRTNDREILVKFMIDAGYSVDEIKTSGIVINVTKDTLADASSPGILRGLNFTYSELLKFKFTHKSLVDAGYGIVDVLNAGYGYDELIKKGYKHSDLLEHGFDKFLDKEMLLNISYADPDEALAVIKCTLNEIYNSGFVLNARSVDQSSTQSPMGRIIDLIRQLLDSLKKQAIAAPTISGASGGDGTGGTGGACGGSSSGGGGGGGAAKRESCNKNSNFCVICAGGNVTLAAADRLKNAIAVQEAIKTAVTLSATGTVSVSGGTSAVNNVQITKNSDGTITYSPYGTNVPTASALARAKETVTDAEAYLASTVTPVTLCLFENVYRLKSDGNVTKDTPDKVKFGAKAGTIGGVNVLFVDDTAVTINLYDIPVTMGISRLIIFGDSTVTSLATSSVLNNDYKSVMLAGFTGLDSFGPRFMYYCTALTSIAFPSLPALTSVGNDFMVFCLSLTSITFPSLPALTSVGNDFMSYCILLRSIAFPSLPALETIGYSFMSYCTVLTSITFPSLPALETIGYSFMSYCTALTSIAFPSLPALETIENGFMSYCTALTSITFPQLPALTSVGNDFMYDCKSLISIDLSKFVNADSTKKIKIGASFMFNFYLKGEVILAITLPDGKPWRGRADQESSLKRSLGAPTIHAQRTYFLDRFNDTT